MHNFLIITVLNKFSQHKSLNLNSAIVHSNPPICSHSTRLQTPRGMCRHQEAYCWASAEYSTRRTNFWCGPHSLKVRCNINEWRWGISFSRSITRLLVASFPYSYTFFPFCSSLLFDPLFTNDLTCRSHDIWSDVVVHVSFTSLFVHCMPRVSTASTICCAFSQCFY